MTFQQQFNDALYTISSCLTTKTEKYVNENNYIVNSAILQHRTGDLREQEEMFQERSLS